MQASTFKISGRLIGSAQAPYMVAELSANHLGSLDGALALIDAAADAGADAVKLQTYTADTITIDHHGPGFDIEGGLWDGRSLYELYEEAHTPWEWHEALFARARKMGMAVFSTPFDATAVDFLETFDPPAYKIASFECTDIPLITKVAATGRPMIISTGMANHDEIGEAVAAARDGGAAEICLLHCVSAYPAPAGDYNLRTIADLAATFDVVAGLSDHTEGVEVPIAAAALGAALIEKHFTLRRSDGGPDAAFSLEPAELRRMIEGCRLAHEALGRVDYTCKASETANVQFRRSIYVVADTRAGEVFTADHIRCIRPGFGLPPKRLTEVVGRTAARDLKRGDPLDEGAVIWDDAKAGS